MLSEAQITQYHEDGFVIADYRLSDTTLFAIRQAHSRFITRFPQFNDYCPGLLPYELGFLQFARDDIILDMVAQLIGNDIALWNSSFFAKPARTGTRTPWHQDGKYWHMRPLATCTVWMAIDDSTRENGCLQVIRGSHREQRLRQHETNDNPGLALNLELPATEFDPSRCVDLVMEAGQISLHDVYLVHGSQPNRSAFPRRGMTLRFMPTTSHYDRDIEARENAKSPDTPTPALPLFLMRGVDRSNRNDFS